MTTPEGPKREAGGKTPWGAPAQPATAAIPPELLLRRDRSIRYERGGAVYATDGRLGYLRQVVVDESAVEVVALVVEVGGTSERVFVSPDLVDKTAGAAVFLTVDRAGFAAHVAGAPPYRADRLAKAKLKALRGGDGALDRPRPRRAITKAERDAVVTPVISVIERGLPATARLESAV
jgi:hypothetical protein